MQKTVQVVIEIPETDYEWMKRNPFPLVLPTNIEKAIANGTVLPKHGRLKDVDEYLKISWEHPDYNLSDDAPTILEAWGNEE